MLHILELCVLSLQDFSTEELPIYWKQDSANSLLIHKLYNTNIGDKVAACSAKCHVDNQDKGNKAVTKLIKSWP
jgi:hypothetical protein